MRRHVTTLSRAFGFFGILSAASLQAQTSTIVNLATINASQAADGLGFQITSNQDWQWAAVAAAGGTHARISCSWAGVEQQTPPPNNQQASPGYIQDPNCAAGLQSAKRYGIHPTIVAAFGAPFHQILTVTVPQGAAKGATSIDIQFSSGVGGDTLASVKFPYDYICPQLMNGAISAGRCSTEMSSRNSPQGTLVTGIKLNDSEHATLTLASALSAALPADASPYMINEILYPSTASNSPQDSSVIAYGNYVSFLANDMAAHGVTGDIEIWNEPPWKQDSWDFRPNLYDSGTWTGPTLAGANFGFAANLQHKTFPAGITATWNGTSGNGMASLLGSQMLQYAGEKLLQPSTTVTKESTHPYGGYNGVPEYTIMNPACLEAAAKSSDAWGRNIYTNGRNCYLPGLPTGSNLMQSVEWDDIAKLTSPSYGIGHSVTETNNAPFVGGQQLQQARSNIRQFIAFQALGITPVEFFEMWNGVNGSDPSFSFVDYNGSTFVPRIGYKALAGLMADIDSISNAPITSNTAALSPSVQSFTGTFPLTTVSMVGSRQGATANSVALYVWQLSTCSSGFSCWFSVVTPPGTTTINVPSNLKVTSVRDMVTQASVSYSTNGQQITFAVADDPIEVLTDPTSYNGGSTTGFLQQTSLALAATPNKSTYGDQVTLTATLTPFNTKSNSTDGQKVSIYDGATLLGTPTLASGFVSISLDSLSVGAHSLRAVYTGDRHFSGNSASASLTVVAASPQLTAQPIADQTYGIGSAQLQISSHSSGIISYAVVSGPARIGTISSAGASVSLVGAGPVVLQVNQQATAGYTSQSVQISFTVNPATPQMTFNAVATQTYGNRAVYLLAGSASHGAVSYSVVSGPATISGSAVTATGAGTIVVKASQAAASPYTAASITQSYTVLPKAPTLTVANVGTKTFGASPAMVTSTSTSPGTITYSVVSGPASVSGNLVQLLGAGTVVIRADQQATTNYTTATAQTSFTIQPGLAQLTLNSFATQTFGVAPLALHPTTLSPAPIAFHVLLGPAHISGTSVVLDGDGYIVVQATQAATANYQTASAQVGFRVNEGTPALTFQPVPDQVGLTPSFRVNATSKSTASISYRVLSGPAVMTGNIVTVKGFGTVLLQAVQPAVGAYLSAAAQTTFMVIPTDADVQ